MTDLLQQAIAEIQKLPADQQDEIAARLLAELKANADSESATQELLAIPGLLERIQQNQATPKAEYTNWRTLRSDV